MYIDEEIFKKVLMDYGFTPEDVLNAAKKHKKPLQEQDWIYLIHSGERRRYGAGPPLPFLSGKEYERQSI